MFLQTGCQRHAADGLMLWDDQGDIILHEMEYKDGVLTIQQEGYYFVYSKIYFAEKHDISLLHSVVRTTDRLPKEMVLLMSREYHPKSAKNIRTNSYIGGMFLLFKGDSIFVKVNNTQVILSTPAENYFGAYMV